jgi:hypothetical protein
LSFVFVSFHCSFFVSLFVFVLSVFLSVRFPLFVFVAALLFRFFCSFLLLFFLCFYVTVLCLWSSGGCYLSIQQTLRRCCCVLIFLLFVSVSLFLFYGFVFCFLCSFSCFHLVSFVFFIYFVSLFDLFWVGCFVFVCGGLMLVSRSSVTQSPWCGVFRCRSGCWCSVGAVMAH